LAFHVDFLSLSEPDLELKKESVLTAPVREFIGPFDDGIR
jgi:hypothetical protein